MSVSRAMRLRVAPRRAHTPSKFGDDEKLAKQERMDATCHWVVSAGQHATQEPICQAEHQTPRRKTTKPVQETEGAKGAVRRGQVPPVLDMRSVSGDGSRSSEQSLTPVVHPMTLPPPPTAPVPPPVQAVDPSPPVRFSQDPQNRARLHNFLGATDRKSGLPTSSTYP